jgi:GR25 family glycosyltransferase involved in LPS biosynthesis
MKAFTIVIQDNTVSEKAFKVLLESHSQHNNNSFTIKKFGAVTPELNERLLREHGLAWNYPWEKKEFDKITGLWKTPYSTRNRAAKISCSLSHFLLWKTCIETNEPILILEHDAQFIQKFNPEHMLNSDYEIIGINSPRNATRKAAIFERLIQSNKELIQPVPRIDDPEIPQGLAGASAYIIKPTAAKIAVKLFKTCGVWPNDAMLCYQLFKDSIGVTKTFYTKVQGTTSTTT